jgi:signal peptidase II
MLPRKARLFWPLLATLLAADCTTKELAETHLVDDAPRAVIGDVVRLRLEYNTEAAMSLPVGPHPRVVLSLIGMLVLMVLWRLYRSLPDTARWRAAALGAVVGGALGNLGQRMSSPRGVTDFIDIGVGAWRFWTFNVADIGVTLGAVALAVAIWRQAPDPDPATADQPLPDGA